jgi:hypothetical protein
MQILVPSVFILVAVLVVAVQLYDWIIKNGSIKRFIALLPSLIFAYGLIAFALPGGIAEDFVPNTWQWPTTSEPQVLVLDDGRRVTTLKSAVRIQLYDSSGNCLNGWYAPFDTNRMEILGTGPDRGWGEDRNTISVDAGGKNLLLFTPEAASSWKNQDLKKSLPPRRGALKPCALSRPGISGHWRTLRVAVYSLLSD